MRWDGVISPRCKVRAVDCGGCGRLFMLLLVTYVTGAGGREGGRRGRRAAHAGTLLLPPGQPERKFVNI